MKLKNSYYLIVTVLGLFLSSCVHKQPKLDFDFGTDLIVGQKDVSIVFVPANKRIPPHLLVTKTERYRLNNDNAVVPLKREITIGPLMHEISLTAQIQKNGKTVRDFKAQKISQTIVNETQRVWSPARSKLALLIPYLKADEEAVITTTYSWMDIRWHDPILFEENEPTLATHLIIDVPFGIKTHFQATNEGLPYNLAPNNIDHEKAIWGQKDNQAGLGTRFIFEHNFGREARSRPASERMQLFFSFEPPMQSERNPAFDNWERVASYLYDRIDRYDLASNAIRDFTRKETEKKPDDLAKVTRIFSFLNNEIEKRATLGSYLDQEVQPATKTFAKRFGSPFDNAILGKAMLISIGLDAELMAVSSPSQNPELTDFYSPALFYSTILAVTLNGRTYYYDPSKAFENLEQLPTDLPGSRLLTIRKTKGQIYTLPKTPPPAPEPLIDPNAPVIEENPALIEEPKAPVIEKPVPEKAPAEEKLPPLMEEPKAPTEVKPMPEVQTPAETKPLPLEEYKPSEPINPSLEVPQAPPSEEKPSVIEVPNYEERPPVIEMPPTSSVEGPSGPAKASDESLFEDRASIMQESTPKLEEPNAIKEPVKHENP